MTTSQCDPSARKGREATISLPDPKSSIGAVRAVTETHISPVSGATCRAYRFNVRLNPDADERIELHGVLSSRRPLNEVSSIQVLLAGGSNNGTFWDWPVEPDENSYVRHATLDGFATLNLDRPGYGYSDRPDPATTDFAVQAYVIDQVLAGLKSGALGYQFEKVALNGHSMGGMVAWRTASKYRSPDAVIVSGVGHNLADDAMRLVFENVQPIESHPGYGPERGWLPGYYVRKFTPVLPTSVVDYCTTLLQDTVMIAELDAISKDSRDETITKSIVAPVLFALGEHDLRWCSATGDCSIDPVFTKEADFYQPDLDFTSFIIPKSGHLNTKDGGCRYFAARVSEWLRARGF